MPGEERRLVTALFGDLVGFTSLSESLDPEEVREIQAAYFAAMSAQIERFGGIVEKYAGDAVLALFGVPVAHEDDPERAVLCALGMQRAMLPVAEDIQRRYQIGVAVRVGVNTGEVVSGSWDASGEQQAAVTGDAVNVAARMQAAADPGGVLVGIETRRLSARRFQFGERQLLTLKGKAEPVPAYVVLGIREQVGERWEAGEGPGPRTPLVGRDPELEVISTAWASAGAGEGQVLIMVGEPGIGKSRLLAEAVEHIARGGETRVLRARCLSYGQSVSLWLIADLLRSLCVIPEDVGPETVRDHITQNVDEVLSGADETDRAIARDVLGEVLGLPPGESLVAAAGPQIRRGSLIRLLGLILASLSERSPVLLLLEDLHWLDSASGEILEALLREVRGRSILVLATQRPGWIPPWSQWEGTQQLILRPLGADDATILAQAVLGDVSLSDALQGHLRDRAEGNPFFMEELVHYLQEIGGLEEQEGEIQLRPGVAEKLPATLTEVLLARLDLLENRVKSVAQVGSVIGRSFAVRLLAQVMEREEALLADPLRSLQEAEITYQEVEGELQHVFWHVLLRDAAYSMLLRRRQRQLHLAVGRAMAHLYPSDEYVELIAYHYARTEVDAEAAEWLERAGDRAAATYANEAAIEHYRAALERLERCGAEEVTRAGIEERLGEVLFVVSRYQEAQAVQERAVEHYETAGQVEEMGRAAARLGLYLDWGGESEEAKRRLEGMATELIQHGPSAASVRVQTYLADVFQSLGQYEEMLHAAERASELARAIGDEMLRGRAEERRGLALLYLGRTEESRTALEDAFQVAEAAGELYAAAVALSNLGHNRASAGELTDAVQLIERALELARRIGFGQYEILDHVSLSGTHVTLGEWAAAREHLERAEELAAMHGAAAWVAPLLPLYGGELALREGDWEAATQQLSRAAELGEEASQEAYIQALTVLAELEILEGEPERARERLTPWLDEEGANLPQLLPILAWAYLELGETGHALELAQQAEREARRRQTLVNLPDALRIKGMAMGRLGRTEEAREALTEGRERAQKIPEPYTEARILVELGQLDRREAEADQARERLQEALTIFQRLGAQKDVERTEQTLTERAGG